MLVSDVYEYRDSVLHVEGVSTLNLAEKFDTPLYVMSETRIRQNYRRLLNALSRHFQKIRIYYSAKANTNLSVLRILKEEGAYIDTVSVGEVYLALEAGFPRNMVLFTGTNVRDDELRYLSDSGVVMNIDSLSQMSRLLAYHRPEVISVRVNPEIGAGHHVHVITAGKDSKFGIWENDVIRAYSMARDTGVKKFGIQMHIGSGIQEVEPLLRAAEKLLDIADSIHRELGIEFDFIDFGGGLGVPYKPDEEALNLEVFSERVLELFKERTGKHGLGDPSFCMEPGRFIVADTGLLLTRVNTVKVTPYKIYVGVDAGFNTLVRPVMYGSYHHIVLANRVDTQQEETYDIAGPLCESGDLLARDRKLPKIREGDLLAILDAGAYGFSMSSQYNSRPRCAEVLVKGEEYSLIRQRESFDALLEGQRIPPWLL